MNPSAIQYIRAAREALVEEYPDLADDAEFLADVLEGETDIVTIMARLIEERDYCEAQAAACRAVSERYDHKAERWQSGSNVRRQMMRAVLAAGGLPKIRTALGTVSLHKGREKLVLADSFQPPQGYQIVEVKPDKDAIRKALEAGETMPGAVLSQSPDFVTVR